MIHPMYPINEMPFDAYCVLLDHYSSMLDEYTPTTLEEDLKTGKLRAMIFWYPVLIGTLYSLAYEGVDFRDYLEHLNPHNVYFFEDIFRDTVKKLDNMRLKKLNSNHLNEIAVVKGKIQ